MSTERTDLKTALDAERANRESLEACVDRDVKKIKDLQTQLSQLQALVRALPDQLATIEKDLAPMNLGTMTIGDMKVFDKTKALVMQTVMARLKRTLTATSQEGQG